MSGMAQAHKAQILELPDRPLHVDIAEVRTAEEQLYLSSPSIGPRSSSSPSSTRRPWGVAAELLLHLIQAVPYGNPYRSDRQWNPLHRSKSREWFGRRHQRHVTLPPTFIQFQLESGG